MPYTPGRRRESVSSRYPARPAPRKTRFKSKPPEWPLPQHQHHSQPLCPTTEFSLPLLAQLYGGPFYDSFAGLTYSVRTGNEAFAHRYGQHHFTYFAERPELGTLFNRAMAASAEMFTPVPALVDFSGARRVVDVGGGNGALLTRVLRTHGHLEGVLLERPQALEATRKELAAAGLDRRCSFVVGDFTVAVPEGGDVYLLSRVLHDWDDERCPTLLRRCARAMRAGSELLVVERLLRRTKGRRRLRWPGTSICCATWAAGSGPRNTTSGCRRKRASR
ncbi:methyltransferase [Streptomyces sp. NPDC051001]|uniref:methyltransferase n=1 Tax=Streptomyces sp. NPDC051001 TaxID=3155795 RepID=UPI0034335966